MKYIAHHLVELSKPKMTVLGRSLVKAAVRQLSTSAPRRGGHGVEPPGAVRLRVKRWKRGFKYI